MPAEKVNLHTDVEGGGEDPVDLGAFPIDSINIHTQPRSVFEVCRRIDNGMCVLNPDFQRDFVWDELRQSKLIESALLRIPLPVFYLAEAKNGKVIVVDGLQRLTTFHRFLTGQFKLKGLTSWAEANGKTFSDLPATLKTRIEDTPLILYVIDSKVPEEARYEIFARVNSGVPLTRQQMRNCIYTGPATKWLKDMAEYSIFRIATMDGLSSETMRDRECINRYAAFKILGWQNYNGKMDEFLGKALTEMNRGFDFDYLTKGFLLSMQFSHELFGEQAFRKSMDGISRRSIINVALFDIMSVGFSGLVDQNVLKESEPLTRMIRRLLLDHEFNVSISRSTNSASAVRIRFSKFQEALASFRK